MTAPIGVRISWLMLARKADLAWVATWASARALRNYVTTKLDRITRHFDQVVDVKVLLTVEKQKEKERRQRAECNIHVKGSDLFAESSHADLYAAVDELVDKLDRQVGRHKTRIQDHHHDAPKRLM